MTSVAGGASGRAEVLDDADRSAGPADLGPGDGGDAGAGDGEGVATPERWTHRLRADLVAVVAPLVAARVLVGLGWVLARAIADRWYPFRPDALTEGLVAWDGTFYRDIGLTGYENLPLDSLRFFPLYPVLGRGLSLGFDGNQGFALVLVANLAAVVAAILIRRLVLALGFDREVAARAVWASVLFPGGFVLVWAYAEGLFLATAIGACLAARRQRWLVAALLGTAAGLTRPIGILLVAAVAVMAAPAALDRSRLWTERAAAALAGLGPALGCALYVGWVERAWGKLGLPYTVQSDLRGESINPVSRLGRGLVDLVGAERFGDGLHVPFAILFVLLAVVAWRRLPRELALFASLLLVVSLSAANLNSLERYGLNAFPLAIALAVWASTKRREWLGLAVGGAGLVGLSALAWLGLYVP